LYLTYRVNLTMSRAWVRFIAQGWIVAIALSCYGNSTSHDSNDTDLPTFTSSNGMLDLLVIAKPKTISLGDFHPTAWVFEMCQEAVARGDNCPDDSQTVSPYGGIRLQLTPGDHLRMRLVNHLPPAPADAAYAHGVDTMMSEMLAANPVNIHTHGLIVEPRKADATDPTYGDYVYVLDYPAGKLPAMAAPDVTASDQPIQYDIYIPRNHPSGIYWFHPHVHGLTINQLSEGLSGIITIGNVTDYLSPEQGNSTIPVRYFVLKDMQVLANGAAQDQESARFCSPFTLAGVSRNGFCQGRDSLGMPDERDERPGNFEGGAWFFTINGSVFPQIPAPADSGELWRFLNAGASRAYDLVIQDDQTGNDLPFQVVSLDGVALAAPQGAVAAQSGVGTVEKAHTVPCPVQSSVSTSHAVCATHLVLFPSSRAEIWVFPQNRPATLKTLMLYTGPKGDRWPEADLAHLVVQHGSNTAAVSLLTVKPFQQTILSSQGLLGAPVRASFAGVSSSLPLQDARQLLKGAPGSSSNLRLNAEQIATIKARLNELSQPRASLASPACSALPPGHRRRIFFGVPLSDPKAFGLGYEEVDENDRPVPGTFRDVAPFDPSVISICLTLGAHNTPAMEEWELVNLSAEAHNFHMHQTEFYVLPQNAPAGNAGSLMDNVVLPNGGKTCDGSVPSWRAGRCPVQTVVVRIPFAEPGDFVYHCHIGEHEDGGMMAHIRVIASQ
jgi:L-ascorbate oxidase